MGNRTMLVMVILLLITGGLFVHFFKHAASSQNPQVAQQPLRIAFVDFPGFAHVYVAKQKQFFEKNGVQVEFVLRKKIIEVETLYREGKVDGLLEIYTNFIAMLVNGTHSKVVYVVDYSNTGDAIIGQKELTSLADLKGRLVSFDGINTASHLYVLKALN